MRFKGCDNPGRSETKEETEGYRRGYSKIFGKDHKPQRGRWFYAENGKEYTEADWKVMKGKTPHTPAMLVRDKRAEFEHITTDPVTLEAKTEKMGGFRRAGKIWKE